MVLFVFWHTHPCHSFLNLMSEKVNYCTGGTVNFSIYGYNNVNYLGLWDPPLQACGVPAFNVS